jgi:hypothetical protein
VRRVGREREYESQRDSEEGKRTERREGRGRTER